MKNPFNSLHEAILLQNEKLVERPTHALSGVEVIDSIQFYTPGVAWLIIAEDFSLGDYEENVTQYGLNTAGRWVAVSASHCSCFGWDECDDIPEEYPSLDVLLAADRHAAVILKHWATLLELHPYLAQYR